MVLVNKTDCLPPGELPRLLAVLGALHPGAPLIPIEHGRVAPGELMGARRFDAEAAAERPGWLRAINARAEARAEGPSTSGHAHAHGGQHSEAEKYGVSTFVYNARRCVRLSGCSGSCSTACSGIEAPVGLRWGIRLRLSADAAICCSCTVFSTDTRSCMQALPPGAPAGRAGAALARRAAQQRLLLAGHAPRRRRPLAVRRRRLARRPRVRPWQS